MAKSKSLPLHATVVRTYAELDLFARAFDAGHLNLLLLLGAPGLGKSRAVRQALGDDVCWVDGNASPFGIYMMAYEHRGQPMVLDDVDGLYRDRQGIRLLKALCQTELVKALSWESNTPTLAARGIPRKFKTNSRIVLIGNRWRSVNEDVRALEDRGHIVHFDPPPHEIHLHAAQWFWEQEVFDFVGAQLHLMGSHSLRVYYLAYEQKCAGLDWRRGVLARCLTGAALEVAKLKSDPNFSTEKDRERAFVAAGHGCRATYFNHVRSLKATDGVPAIKLVNNAPPAAPPVLLNIREILRRRQGKFGEG